MKPLLLISIIGFLSCNNPNNHADQSKESQTASLVSKSQTINEAGKSNQSQSARTATDWQTINKGATDVKTERKGKTGNSKYYTNQDPLIIVNEIGDTLKYGRVEFNDIIDNNPELISDNTQKPDQLYSCYGAQGKFGSEAGRDNYYMLYAYFLKSRNGDKKYSKIRQNLIGIYHNVNSLFDHFQYGGTYFDHQYARILGYAEYSVYLYKKNENYRIEKTYDITKEKELYIKSLRQLIVDEMGIDGNTVGKEKIDRTKKLNKIVDDIAKAITDNFYLRRTQAFHYRHYEYY